MRSRALLWLGLLLSLFVSITCHAQSLPTTPTSPQVVPPYADAPVTPPSVAQPSQGPSDAEKQRMLDNCKRSYDKLQNDFLKSQDAAQQGYNQYFYQQYAPELAKIQLDAFRWQATASRILIWVVVVVCLSGIIFSGYQLWRATAPGPVGASAEKLNTDPLAANVELSWQSVRVTSSVVGLVVLVISVAYLYLFLKEVYNIEVIPSPAAIESAPSQTNSTPVPK